MGNSREFYTEIILQKNFFVKHKIFFIFLLQKRIHELIDVLSRTFSSVDDAYLYTH